MLAMQAPGVAGTGIATFAFDCEAVTVHGGRNMKRRKMSTLCTPRRLALSQETILRLTVEQLEHVAGGDPRSLLISCANTHCTGQAR